MMYISDSRSIEIQLNLIQRPIKRPVKRRIKRRICPNLKDADTEYWKDTGYIYSIHGNRSLFIEIDLVS